MVGRFLTFFGVLATLAAAPLQAQNQQERLDRVDPSIVERSLPELPLAPSVDRPPLPSVTPLAGNALAGGVMVGAVRIEGAGILAPRDFAGAIEPYLGGSLDASQLQALAGAIAGVARDRGLLFATAWIAPQRVSSGILIVRLDEGAIDAVRVEGAASDAVRPLLDPVAAGQPVSTRQLERALSLVEDVPGVSIDETRYTREGERGVLIVRASRERVAARARIDNYGSSAIGPVRARLRIDLNGVLGSDDRMRVEGVMTPLQPREFGLVRAQFDKGIGGNGASISLSGYFARSRPSGSLRTRETRGESSEVAGGFSYPVVRSRATSLWASIDLDARTVAQEQLGARVRDDKLTNLRVGLSGYSAVLGGTLSGGVYATRGLDLFGSTRAGDPRKSRVDGSARFTKGEAYLSWTRDVSDDVSLLVSGEGQLASRPLLASEEFGVGGPRYGRGYDYSERLGDRGAAALIELRYDLGAIAKPVRRTQVYGFVDGGVADNLRGGRGGGSIASAGGGVRMWLRNGLSASFEVAQPLTGERYESGDKSPRLSFTIGANF